MPRLGRRRSWLRIPAPVAEVGARVEVRNYRCRSSRWVLGTLEDVTFWPAERYLDAANQPHVRPGFWRYRVRVEPVTLDQERGRRRRAYRLTVSSYEGSGDYIRRAA